MNNLIYRQPFEAYRLAEGLNKSSIDKILLCPAEYKAMVDTPPWDQPDPTPSMKFGTYFHSRVLTPELCNQQYHVQDVDPRTKAGKEEKAKAEADGLTVISANDFDRAQMMLQNLTKHPRVDALLNKLGGDSEVSMFWDFDLDGEPLQAKGRIDRLAILPGGDVIGVDIKTTSGGLTPEAVSRHIAQFAYHRQSAWYVNGLAKNGLAVRAFVFVFVQTAPPYLCTAVTLDEQAEALGMRECKMAARIYRECMASDTWPGYSTEIEEIGLPVWYDRVSPAASEIGF